MPLKEVRKLFLEIDDNGNGVITERGKCVYICNKQSYQINLKRIYE